MVFYYYSMEDSLQPPRIAAAPSIILDVVVKSQLSLSDSITQEDLNKRHLHEQISLQPLLKALPDIPQEKMVLEKFPVSNTNSVYGLEETAVDCYSHIDNPAFGPAPRAPQGTPDDQSVPIIDTQESKNAGTDKKNGTQRPLFQEHSGPTSDASAQTLKARAALGDPIAQVALGDIYERGHEVHQDYQAAMDW